MQNTVIEYSGHIDTLLKIVKDYKEIVSERDETIENLEKKVKTLNRKNDRKMYYFNKVVEDFDSQSEELYHLRREVAARDEELKTLRREVAARDETVKRLRCDIKSVCIIVFVVWFMIYFAWFIWG